MKKVALFCQIVLLFHVSAFAGYRDLDAAGICSKIFVPGNAVMMFGPYITETTGTQLVDHQVKIQVGGETLTLLTGPKPSVTSTDSRYQNSGLRVFKAANGDKWGRDSTSVNRHLDIEKDLIGQIYFVVHPEHGIIAVDESGVVLRLPDPLTMLKGDEISTILTAPRIHEKNDLIVAVTKYGKAFQLWFSGSKYDGWPLFNGSEMWVHQVSGDPRQISSYQFIVLDEFSLKKITYNPKFDRYNNQEFRGYDFDDENVVGAIYSKLSASARGHDKNLIRINSGGKAAYLFSYDRGLAIWNPGSDQLVEKSLAVDAGVPVEMKVHGIFDLEAINRIALITDTGHLRLIDRSDLLNNSSTNTFRFLNSEVGPLKAGPLEDMGAVLRSEVIPPGNVVKLSVLEGVKSASNNEYGSMANGESMKIQTYLLRIDSNGNALLTTQPEDAFVAEKEGFLKGWISKGLQMIGMRAKPAAFQQQIDHVLNPPVAIERPKGMIRELY